MDKETRDFIEASFEKWTGVISGEFGKVHQEFSEVRQEFGKVHKEFGKAHQRIDALENEVQETRSAVLSIEKHIKDRIDIQDDNIRYIEQRVERVEDHVGLPHSLTAD